MRTCKKQLHTYDDSKHRTCPECRKVSMAKYIASPKGKTSQSAYKKTAKGKAVQSAATASYQKANPGKRNALTAKRNAAKLQRTPKWLSKADLKEIQCYYLAAEMMTTLWGFPHHVDHIVPLRGKEVSGLHVPSNLQILTESENTIKNNSYDLLQGPIKYY